MRMYSDYFGIRENAFAITPDPRYLFLSDRHREAMAHLLFGTEEGGGFVQLTGEVGTGKTTICRAFLEQLPKSVDVALLLSPPDSARDLLLAIAAELRLRVRRRDTPTGELVALLNQRLLETHAAGRRTVVIIDEAQNILPEVLEQVRLLTNLETPTHKLLQVFLIGQPELRQKLRHPALRQVAQRITARYHLEPLSLSETQGYIRHRLAVAGCRQWLFSGPAIRLIHRHSQGIPRVINILCDRALIGAYATEADEVNAAIVRHAAMEWRGEEGGEPFFSRTRATAAVMAAGLLFALATGFTVRGSAFSSGGVDGVVSNGKEIVSEQLSRSDSARDAPSSIKRDVATAGRQAGVTTEPPRSASVPLLTPLPVAEAEGAAKTMRVHDVVRIASPVALKSLLARWAIKSEVTDRLALCAQASRHALSCMEGFGRWDTLRAYNRPVLLSLHRRNGNEAYLTMVGMENDHALIATNEGVIPLALRELDAYWSGEYLLIWRPPLGGVSMIAAGANEQAVEWLRSALQRVDGLATSTKEFDQELGERLRAFQRSRGLTADGMAGPHTLIHLNTVVAEQQVPLLVATNRND